jgi:flagellar basal body rod protein FlgB
LWPNHQITILPFNHAAMRVKNKKLELILGNIANAPTSGINAKDLDFSSILCSSFYRTESGRNISFGETSSKHMGALTDQVRLIQSPLSPSM